MKVSEVIESNLELIGGFIERGEPVPEAMINNIKFILDLVAESIPENNLNDFLKALDRLPVK